MSGAIAMVLCSRCGADNTPDSRFCKYCGTRFGDVALLSPQTPPQNTPARSVADTGKRLGDELGRMGGMLGKNMADWWITTMGILSPILFGIFGVVVIIFGLFVTDTIASNSDSPQFWDGLHDFIIDRFLLLTGLMFLGAFHGYLYWRYRRNYRWIGPIVSATIFTAWAWVVAQVLLLAGRYSEQKEFGDVGRFLEAVLVLVFVLALLTGYAIVWFSLVSPANWDKPEPKN